jgi:hypothetical protein
MLKVCLKHRKKLRIDACKFFHVSSLAKLEALFNNFFFGIHMRGVGFV